MAEKNGNAKPPQQQTDLDDFEARLRAAQGKRPKPVENQGDDGSMLGLAWRMSTELVIAVLVGTGLGYGLDILFGTKPWIMLVGIGLGFAAGVKNTLMAANKMQKAEDAKNHPPAQDLPDTDEDDDY